METGHQGHCLVHDHVADAAIELVCHLVNFVLHRLLFFLLLSHLLFVLLRNLFLEALFRGLRGRLGMRCLSGLRLSRLARVVESDHKDECNFLPLFDEVTLLEKHDLIAVLELLPGPLPDLHSGQFEVITYASSVDKRPIARGVLGHDNHLAFLVELPQDAAVPTT